MRTSEKHIYRAAVNRTDLVYLGYFHLISFKLNMITNK